MPADHSRPISHGDGICDGAKRSMRLLDTKLSTVKAPQRIVMEGDTRKVRECTRQLGIKYMGLCTASGNLEKWTIWLYGDSIFLLTAVVSSSEDNAEPLGEAPMHASKVAI